MKQKSVPGKAPADQVIKDIRRQTRRHYSARNALFGVLSEMCGLPRLGGGRTRTRTWDPLINLKQRRASSWRSLQDPYGLFHPSKHALFSATHAF